jgi:hypothetical protein
MLKIGSIVSLSNSVRIGVVVELFTLGQRKLACVHYIDLNTGKGELWVCPDHARCGSKGHTCPIHSANVDTHTLTPMTTNDVNHCVEHGLICADLARIHNAPAIRISRKTSHRYYIETLEEGFVTRKVITDPKTGDEWQTAAALCNVQPDFRTCPILTNPDSEDYKTFAAMFADHPLGPIA